MWMQLVDFDVVVFWHFFRVDHWVCSFVVWVSIIICWSKRVVIKSRYVSMQNYLFVVLIVTVIITTIVIIIVVVVLLLLPSLTPSLT